MGSTNKLLCLSVKEKNEVRSMTASPADAARELAVRFQSEHDTGFMHASVVLLRGDIYRANHGVGQWEPECLRYEPS